MICSSFGKCASCALYELPYKSQIELKKQKIAELFGCDFEFFESLDEGFRSRAEFRVYHDNDGSNYAMRGFLGEIVKIKECNIVAHRIKLTMEPLLGFINSDAEFRKKLYGVEFLSSNSGGLIVTLIYHRKLDDELSLKASELKRLLDATIILRARGQKEVFGEDFLFEIIKLGDKEIKIKKLEGAFSQPNSALNQKMVEFATSCDSGLGGDLLELYCGIGNFTLPLSFCFEKVLATEVSKSSLATASESAKSNGVTNISFARLSSSETAGALKGERRYNRLGSIDIKSFSLNTLFVDPPRSGLDEESLEFAKSFQSIIYISCNPETLHMDMEALKSDFEIERFAVFDQFPHTHHLECGALIKSK